jgi:hypothetical protein
LLRGERAGDRGLMNGQDTTDGRVGIGVARCETSGVYGWVGHHGNRYESREFAVERREMGMKDEDADRSEARRSAVKFGETRFLGQGLGG